MHLTQAQHGAYILFLHWIYTTEKPIPHKQRFSIARASLDLERSDASFVLEQFFLRKGQFWRNEMAEKVIVESKEKHERRARAGQIGGLKRASNATELLEDCSTNYTHTNNQEQERKNLSNGFLVGSAGKKNSLGNGHVTIQDPSERLSRFQAWLAKVLGRDGWVTVTEAADPTKANHRASLAICRAKTREMGKGWPNQWPT